MQRELQSTKKMNRHSYKSKLMSLNLSSDVKPRLKWTRDLHQRFVDAVNQLGGAEKASPKSVMRIMGIHGLTLYHLKSHLQKYRLGRSHSYHQNKQDSEENQRRHLTGKHHNGENEQTNESSRTAHALKLQMDVQKKLHEQTEVQRHLQLRNEAQGKYLQSVLKKAQKTLSGCSSCSIDVECAKAELSQLMSTVESVTQSSLSALTESESEKDAIDKHKMELNSIDSGPRMIDLNCKGAEE